MEFQCGRSAGIPATWPKLENSIILWSMCPRIISCEPASQGVSRKTLGNLCDPEGHVGTCHWGSKNKNLEHAWGLEEFTIMKVCWFLFALKVNNPSIPCNQKSNGSLLTQSQLWKHWQEILGASRSPHWMQDIRRKCLKCGRIS